MSATGMPQSMMNWRVLDLPAVFLEFFLEAPFLPAFLEDFFVVVVLTGLAFTSGTAGDMLVLKSN